MAPRGEWDFDRDLIILQDPAELERVHAAMRFKHERLNSFQMVHNFLQIPGTPEASIEEKFFWFVEQCKKDGPLPSRGSSSNSRPLDGKSGRKSSVQGGHAASAYVVSPDRRAANSRSRKLPLSQDGVGLHNQNPSHANVFRIPNSQGFLGKDPNSVASTSSKKKKQRESEPHHHSHLNDDESDDEINTQLKTLKKALADLEKKQAMGKGKSKRQPSPVSSSHDSDTEPDRHVHKKGKGKLKEKKKKKRKSRKSRKNRNSSGSSDDSENELGGAIPAGFSERPSKKHKHSDRRHLLRMKNRIPIKVDRAAVYSRIRTICAAMFRGWVHWSKEKRDAKNLLKLHRELRGAFRNGDEIDTIWLERKVRSCLHNRRFIEKSAVKDSYDYANGQYVQPEGMDAQLFSDIVAELGANSKDALHKRAHQGDLGSACSRRVTVRTTNPWGQGGEDGFHGRFERKFGRKALEWEREFAKEWTFKELRRKLVGNAKGEDWVALPGSKSKSEKDAAWLAKFRPEQVPEPENCNVQEPRLATRVDAIPEPQQQKSQQNLLAAEVTQVRTMAKGTIKKHGTKLSLNDSPSISNNSTSDFGSASGSDPGTESSSPVHSESSQGDSDNDGTPKENVHLHVDVPSRNRNQDLGLANFKKSTWLSDEISGADGGDRPHHDGAQEQATQQSEDQHGVRHGGHLNARHVGIEDGPPVVTTSTRNLTYTRSEPVKTRHKKPLNSYKNSHRKK